MSISCMKSLPLALGVLLGTLMAATGQTPSPSAEASDVKASDVKCSNAGEKAKKRKKKTPAPFRWVNPLPKDHHKALQHHTFRSPSLGVDVGYVILLPNAYETSRRRFPVVYYLHGGRPGSEAKSVKLAPIIHDAIASGDVPPAIYVFVNGGPVSHYNMPEQPEAQGADVFIKELIPHIDSTWRTIANRSGRAIEGFSQGGRGTMRLSMRYPELFCSSAPGGGGYATEKVISESGGRESDSLKFAEGDNVWDLARAYAAAERPEVRLLLHVGTEGFNYQNNLEYMEFLDQLGIPYEKVIVPEAPHSAMEIYKKRGTDIMRFHAKNFSSSVK